MFISLTPSARSAGGIWKERHTYSPDILGLIWAQDHRDPWIKRWKVRGSGGNSYVVAVDAKGNYGCSCTAWKFRRQECKHILQVKANGGRECAEIKYREAVPGSVGEVTIGGDQVLYPLVPICPPNVDLVATIVYDLQRAGVDPEQVKDYRDRMFPGGG